MAQEQNLLEKIVSLSKRRGFVFPGSEIYGGMANSWDYGPLGVELKNNIKQLWWDRFVHRRDDIVGIDAALIMNPKVWVASGHVAGFADLMVECKKCHFRFRVDIIDGKPVLQAAPECPEGGEHETTEAKQFNIMFQTFVGPSQDQASVAYFRPETAQAMFVDFKNVVETSRKTLPLGIAQIGKAFRNEITPGNFIFRTREFEQMEIEYFIAPPKTDQEWQDHFERWLGEMKAWLDEVGVRNYVPVEVSEEDRAFYSKRTVDIEFQYPFGQKELYGLAYRTDFDMKNHFAQAPYKSPETGEAFWPHVIEPSWGVDRTLLAILLDAYTEEGEGDSRRVLLKFKPKLAPYKAAVFPLLRNKPDLVAKARGVYEDLRKEFLVAWDDRGNIGKRYYSQDEIGTPYCITIDFQTLEDGTVTVRDRDTAAQERIAASELSAYIKKALA